MSVLSHERSSSLGLRAVAWNCTHHMNVIFLSLATEIPRLFPVSIEHFCHTLSSVISLSPGDMVQVSDAVTNPWRQWNPGTLLVSWDQVQLTIPVDMIWSHGNVNVRSAIPCSEDYQSRWLKRVRRTGSCWLMRYLILLSYGPLGSPGSNAMQSPSDRSIPAP